MLLRDQFIAFIQNHQLFGFNDFLILAVSGGVDSVVLCEVCHQAGFHFAIAHCNFQLRGEESDTDESFVRGLGNKYGVKVLVKKFDTEKFASANSLSIQVAARELRYRWFDEIVHSHDDLPGEIKTSHQSTYLLTAHHANDNIETVLMNFFKGTGITGLRGILPKKGRVIRPFLFAKKQELITFAQENKLSFVEDSSNTSDKYTRNYFRHQLVPLVEKVFPGAEENLIHNIKRFTEIEQLYKQAISYHKKNLVESNGNEFYIPVLKLARVKPLSTIIFEIIKEFGFTAHQTAEVIALLESGSGKSVSSSTHKIIRDRKWLIITTRTTSQSAVILIEPSDEEIVFDGGILHISKSKADKIRISNDPSIALLDAAAITFPLLLRKWKQGDYFYPLGMQKKKKLSRFFIDQKIPVSGKEKVWVVESDKRIIWIVGLRIDDRFKITENTSEVLKISFTG